MRWKMNKSMKRSWFKVPVKVEQINEYLFSDTVQYKVKKTKSGSDEISQGQYRDIRKGYPMAEGSGVWAKGTEHEHRKREIWGAVGAKKGEVWGRARPPEIFEFFAHKRVL